MRRYLMITTLGLAIGTLGIIQSVDATIVIGDFHEELALPDFPQPGPRVLQVLATPVGPSYELTAAHEISNPDNFIGEVDVDLNPSTNILTLTGVPAGSGNYQVIDITISNIKFDTPEQIISGFGAISDNLIAVSTAPVTRTDSFTSNSVTISYSIDTLGDASNPSLMGDPWSMEDPWSMSGWRDEDWDWDWDWVWDWDWEDKNPPDVFGIGHNGTASFQLMLSKQPTDPGGHPSATPEPSTFILAALSLLALAAVSRRSSGSRRTAARRG